MTPEQLWNAYLQAAELRNQAKTAFRTAQDGYFSAEQSDANASYNLLLAIGQGNQQAIDDAAAVKLQTTAALNLAETALAMAKHNLEMAQVGAAAAYRALTQAINP